MKTVEEISVKKKDLEKKVNDLMREFKKDNPDVQVEFYVDNSHVDDINGERVISKFDFKVDVKIK